MKQIHFFDIDNTLWEMQNHVWIIDKRNPQKPLLKISPSEFIMISKGFYRKENFPISYNGSTYYISKQLMTDIQKKKVISPENLGISSVEITQEELINHTKIKFLLYNIKHLIGQEYINICLLTGRSNREKHQKVLNLLRLQLKDMGIELFKVYFVGESLSLMSDENISYKKSIILLEHLIGIKIEEDKFVPYKQDKYDCVYFYDDQIQNIQYANDIQNILNQIYQNTENQEVKDIIQQRFKTHNLLLINNLVGSNQLNKFKTNCITLKTPELYPIKENKLITTYNLFIKNK